VSGEGVVKTREYEHAVGHNAAKWSRGGVGRVEMDAIGITADAGVVAEQRSVD
jgi:hypothetical protein